MLVFAGDEGAIDCSPVEKQLAGEMCDLLVNAEPPFSAERKTLRSFLWLFPRAL